MNDLYLPISGINTYQYCPYRFYLVHVCGEWEDNYHTTKGSLDHETVHSKLVKHRQDYKQTTQVEVSSEKEKVRGKIDIVEERKNRIYPVEFKKGTTSNWINNKLQLCAQAICLEEQVGIKVEFGFLWFIDSHQRKQVQIDKKLRTKTQRVIRKARQVLRSGFLPDKVADSRCDGCSMRRVCLPGKEK